MSGLTTLPSLHHCEEDYNMSMDFNLLQGVESIRSNMTSVVSNLFWLPYNATKAGVGITAGLAYVGGCVYLRALNAVVSGVAGRNVTPPVQNAVGGVRLLTKDKPHYEDRFQGLKDEVAGHGVEVAEVEVITEDGYILEIHNLFDPQRERRGPVVFLQHGLKGCSADWTIGGLAYSLVQRGYDVWMGNFRGNYFSYKHRYFTQEDKSYWDFSFEEHGHYDLPAMLEEVLKRTNARELTYIGHSMGCTAFFVFMSERGHEWADKITEFIGLAPVAKINRMTGFPGVFFMAVPQAIASLNAVGLYHMDVTVLQPILLRPIYNLLGLTTCYAIGYHEMDMDRAQHIFNFNPNPTSTHTLKHYIDCMKDGRFRSRHKRRNANANNNNCCNCNTNSFSMVSRVSNVPVASLSGSVGPVPVPVEDDYVDFDLSKVTCPVRLWYSRGDWVANRNDCLLMARDMPNVLSIKEATTSNKEYWRTFGHQDFAWARESAQKLYNEILDTCFPSLV